MRPCFTILALLAFALAACRSTESCPDGMHFDADGECVADGDAGTRDAGEDGATDSGADARGDAGPCGGACTGATPMCRASDGMCVACLGDADCSGTTPICSAAGACEACDEDADCEAMTAASVCDEASGGCVECMPETEDADCGTESCDPATFACSGIERVSRLTCQACVSDSDCMNADDRCVPMTYMAVPRGGYCLRLVSATCIRPYGNVITAISLSGKAETMYCGVDQTNVSCEAVRALIDGRMCAGGNADACMADGARCETVGAFADRCTYTCGTADDCPMAGAASTCAAGYCGS